MSDSDEASPLLRRLLAAAGYRLEDRPGGLRAVRPRDSRAVFVVDGLRAPNELLGEFPSEAVHRTLVYADEPGPVARAVASDKGIEILDGHTLGPALGELLLASEEHGAGTPTPSRSPLEPPAVVFPEGDRLVRPRLGRTEAEALAGLEGFRYTLRMIPYYVAPYRVRSPAPHGGPGSVSDHLVAVNGLSGRVDVWEPGDRELVSEVEEPSQRFEPSLTEPESRLIAERELRRRHTVSVDHSEQHRGALVIERRRVPPGPEDLRLGTSVLVHVPFWYVEGAEGRVVLDAVTGARTSSGAEDGPDGSWRPG